jgi:DNA topoisomerase-1
MMQEFYDKFHPTVKDVEANAEESGERILGKIQKGKQVSVRLGSLDLWLKLKRMMKRKNSSLMPDQNIGNIGLEALNLFCFQRFREYKEESSGQ